MAKIKHYFPYFGFGGSISLFILSYIFNMTELLMSGLFLFTMSLVVFLEYKSDIKDLNKKP